MKKIILILSLFLTADLAAQDSATKKTGEIYRRWPHYKMDGKNLSNKKLKEEIYKVPAAIPYYQKAKTSKIVGFSLIASTIALAFITRENTTANPSKRNAGYVIAGLATGGTGLFYLIRFTKNLKKSIRIHNEQTVTVY